MPIARDGGVLPWRTKPIVADVRVGEPVRASTLYATAQLAQWVRGRGRCVVPQHSVRSVLDGTTTTVTHRYKTAPSGVAITRVWVVTVQAITSGGLSYGLFTLQAGAGATSGTFSAGTGTWADPVVYFETGCTKATTALEVALVVARTAGKFRVESIGCWELPRAALAQSATDLGIALDSFFPRRPIYESTYAGPYGLAASLLGTDGRRVGHLAWWNDTGAAFSGGYSDLFLTGVPLVPAQDLAADTTRNLECWVYAAASNGTTGGDFVMRDSGGTDSATMTIGVGSTTFSWRGPVTKSFTCEDLSTSNGLRGGAYDTIQVRGRVTAGAGTVIVKGACAYEKA